MPSRHDQLVEVEAVEPTAVVSVGGVPPPPGCGADLDVMDVMAAKALIMTHRQEKHDVGNPSHMGRRVIHTPLRIFCMDNH